MEQDTPKAPKLRFKTFTNNWNRFNFSDVFDFKKTFAYSRNQLVYNGEGMGNIHYGDIHTKYASILDVTNVRIPKIKNSIRLNVTEDDLCKKGDLIIADASEDYKDIGKTIELSNINQNIVAGLHTLLARPIETLIANGFPVRLMQTEKVRKQIMKCATGISVLGISKVNLSKISLYLPKTEEQMRIANFFEKIDKYIEHLKSQKEELEKYKKGMMQKIFSQQIRFKDENGNNFPDWEYKDLNNISKIIKGKQLNKSNLETNYKNGLFAVINGGTLPSGYTVDLNTPKNTITISEGGNSCGYVNLIKENFWCGGHCYKLTEIDTNCDFNYLFNYLKFTQQEIMKLRVGSGLPNIQRKDIEKISIPIPSNSEQNKISKFLNEINIKIEINESRINLAVEWKKGLMQQMFL